MYRLNRYFSWISVLIIAVIMLTACAAPAQPTTAPEQTTAPEVAATEAPAEAPTVGIFLPDKKTMRYDTKDRPIFTEKMKEICPDCEVIGHIADSDAAEQQSAVEQAITNGAKVVAIMAVDTKAAAVIADYAKERGVPVIAYSRLLENSDGVTVNIAFALADIGIAQAESLMEALNEKGIEKPRIVMVNGGPSDSNMPPIRDGAMSVFQPLVDAGKLEIVKSVDTPDWDPNKAQSLMEQILTETGGEIDGVYVMNDGMASGVLAALNSAGIQPIPPITGLDAELAAVQRILTGDQYSSVFLPIENMATTAAEIAYALATTGEVPADLIDGTINNGAIDVPSVFIPVENVDITNIKEKIIDTGFWTLDDICTPEFEQACVDAGLK
jgi:D-xylose transport system substrate-binding protein